MKSRSGFSIVEVGIVIVVIAILATIGTVSYLAIQREARDSKRDAQAQIIVNELEKYFDKNGAYPAGCLYPNCNGRAGFYDYANSSPFISSSATINDLKNILPGISSDFGDPNLPSGQNIFYAQGVAGIRDKKYHYVYAGGLISSSQPRPSVGGAIGGLASDVTWRCGWDHNPDLGSQTTGANNTSSFIFAYYSEVKNKWMVYRGSKGVAMKMNTSPACVDTIEYKS